MVANEGGYVVLTYQFSKDGEQWVGVCEDFQVSTYGDDLDVVKEELDDLVLLTLNGVEALGEREQFFAENRITLHLESLPEPEITYVARFDSFISHTRVPVGA